MHPSTEDLLSIRDGEPVDAVVAERACDAAHEQEIERLRETRDALRRLPELAPPEGAWAAIEAAERETRARGNPWLRRVAGIGVAAAVAAVAIALLGLPSHPRGPVVLAPAPQGDDTSTTLDTPDLTSSIIGAAPIYDTDRLLAGRVVPTSYPALVQESARLDRALRRLSYQRPMMSGGTATTIAGLEDRIALLDEQITYGNARGVPQPQRNALWGERVELMNALVHVRYGQAQPTGF